MTLKEKLEKSGETDIIAVVYENVRILGTKDEIQRALENVDETLPKDVMDKEVEREIPGSAYGMSPVSVSLYVPKEPTRKKEETGTDPVTPPGTGDDSEGTP